MRGVPLFERVRWAACDLVRDARERGILFWDGRLAYIFLHDTKEEVVVDPENPEYQLLMRAYGIAPTDHDIYKHVANAPDTCKNAAMNVALR